MPKYIFTLALQTNQRRNSTEHVKGKFPSIPDYTTISKRISRLNINVEDTTTKESKYNYIIIAIDRTAVGIKITNGGQWLRDKWNIIKGYLKIHVAVNVKSKKIISLMVTSDEHVYDGKVFPRLVQDCKIKIFDSWKGIFRWWWWWYL